MALNLTLDQARELCLRSQFLRKPSGRTGLLDVVGRICGLNSQSARGPYLSLFSRVSGFRREDHDRALYRDRALIRTSLMRRTVHTVPTGSYFTYQTALESSLTRSFDEGLRKVYGPSNSKVRDRLHERLLSILSSGAFTLTDLLPRVPDVVLGYPEGERRRILRWALRELAFLGQVCHAEPTGPWYHFKENRYTLVRRWVRGNVPKGIDAEDARVRLLLDYLRGYGPATVQDFVHWSGLPTPEGNAALEGARDRLTEVNIPGVKGTFWVPGDVSIPRANTERRPEIRFLPEFDPLIMGHRDKSRFMEEAHRKRIFLPLASVVPFFLLNGRVAGVWDFRMTDRTLDISPFEALDPRAERELNKTSEGLRRFMELEVRGNTS